MNQLECIKSLLHATLIKQVFLSRWSHVDHSSNNATQNFTPKYTHILDEYREWKFQLIKSEYDFQRLIDAPAPLLVTEHDWIKLLGIPSSNERYKYMIRLKEFEIKYGTSISFSQHNCLKNKISTNKQPSVNKCTHIKNGLFNNTMFLRLYKTTKNMFYNHRLVHEMIHGQNIVLDLDYQTNIKIQGMLTAHITRFHNFNTKNRHPFCVHICNVKEPLLYNLQSMVGSFTNVTRQSYLDLFHKDQLVYVTPLSSEVLWNYDPEVVYIIGGFVDLRNTHRVMQAKAQTEGLRTMRLPAEEYTGCRQRLVARLGASHVLQILLDMKNSGDWTKAFTSITRYMPNGCYPSLRQLDTFIHSQTSLMTNDRNEDME